MAEIEETIFHDIIKKINNNSLQLASLPDVIIKVNDVMSDENHSVIDVAKVIQHDVALTSRIIHIANSPALRGNTEITSISEAINRLGMALIKNLAICVSLKDKFNAKNMARKDIMDQIMELSIKKSVYGFLIAKHLINHRSPEVSLISGLVSKIGHIVILRYLNDVPEYSTLSHETVFNIVNKFGDEVGDVMLRSWDFPKSIIDTVFGRVIGNPDNPSSSRDIFILVNNYLEYLDGMLPPYAMHLKIDEIIAEYADERRQIESIFD